MLKDKETQRCGEELLILQPLHCPTQEEEATALYSASVLSVLSSYLCSSCVRNPLLTPVALFDQIPVLQLFPAPHAVHTNFTSYTKFLHSDSFLQLTQPTKKLHFRVLDIFKCHVLAYYYTQFPSAIHSQTGDIQQNMFFVLFFCFFREDAQILCGLI